MGIASYLSATTTCSPSGLIKRPSKRNYFPRLKRRRWTSTASTSSDYSELEEKAVLVFKEEEFEVIGTMSSDPEKNKQSIMLNRECELSGGVLASQLVTLGTGPSPSS